VLPNQWGGILTLLTLSEGDVDEVELSTLVYLPPEKVYEFLLDFPRYANYSKYLTEVQDTGDGSPGTQYYLTFAWWNLSYTAHSQVTDVDPPRRIDWRIVKDLDARGYWHIDPVPEEAPEDEETATRVRLHVQFWPDSADAGRLELPSFVSLDWVIGKTKPIIREEAERVVERIVADLEGRTRPVELEIHSTPNSV
jgi:ribosome-associated toxin RatA of RatAB toxin-antitoxin module